MAILLKNGKMLAPNALQSSTLRDGTAGGDALQLNDVLICDGIVKEIALNIESTDGVEVIDLQNKFIAPGLIDVHIHLREPGGEHKETIATGTEAAARGGFTTIAVMPNTNPVPDCKESLGYVHDLINKNAKIRVIPYGAITKNEAGEELVKFDEMAEQVFAFTDDGRGVQTAGMMYEAMVQAKKAGKSIVAHCEDDSLLFGGYLHAGDYAKANGHKGIMSASESVQIARDALLAWETGVHYHVCHISTKQSVEVVRWAKSMGIHITAEISPHHLLLSDKDICEENISDYKMNPPLRSEVDRLACVEGLLDGTIDMIATDHAPHAEEEKKRNIDVAPFGIVGLETAFPLMYTTFVKTGKMTLAKLIDLMATKPAEVFGLEYGRFEVGAVADIAIFDLEKEMTINRNAFKSKGRNTPFDGVNVTGIPMMTIYDGKVVFKEEV